MRNGGLNCIVMSRMGGEDRLKLRQKPFKLDAICLGKSREALV